MASPSRESQAWQESAGGTNRNPRRGSQLGLCQGSRDQQSLISIPRRAVAARQPLCQSLCGVLFIPSKHGVSSMCLDSERVLLSPCIIQSATVLGSSNRLQHTTRSYLVHFSLWSRDKYSSSTQCEADQYMRVVSKVSFIACPFMCLL